MSIVVLSALWITIDLLKYVMIFVVRLRRRLRKSDYEENLVSNIKTNPKVFWKYVNSKMKTRLPVDTSRTSDNGEAVSNLDKANVLNEYFTSVFYPGRFKKYTFFT